MVETTKKHKKGSISEENISTLLQRYPATTLLALLQEVAQVADVKIDWNALVKKTTTGITNAREYQMLWRHLAYRDTLLERLEDEAEPLDDDSDLEYELEAFPAVSSEASAEAAACVKVLIASGVPSDSSLPNGTTVEAPLTINIPNGQSSRVPLENSQLAMQGTNITVPVSVQKQPLSTVPSAEGLDANGSAGGNLPPRKKRKPWSAAEDLELIAAVQKCGEGNWANILKGDFKGDRTASQLSQRWSIIRKRQSTLNVGGGSQLSEAQLAARRAVSLALNMPMVDNLTAACSVSTAGTNSNTTPSNSAHPMAAEALLVSAGVSQAQYQSPQGTAPTTAPRMGASGSSKPRVTSKKTSTKSAISPDALVKAAAFAAGARIATPSDAASLFRAAQEKNAVHIMPGGGPLIKTSGAGSGNTLPSTHLVGHPNVHYIRTGLAATPLSSHSAVPSNSSRPAGTQQVQGHSVNPAAPVPQLNPSTGATASNTSSEAINAATSSLAMDEAKIAEESIVSGSGSALRKQGKEDQTSVLGNGPNEHVAEDQASISGNVPNEQVGEDQTALPNSEAKPESEIDFVENSKHPFSVNTAEDDQRIIVSDQAFESKIANDEKMGLPSKVEVEDEDLCPVEENCEKQCMNGKQEDSRSIATDGSNEKMELHCA
ncbi:hypothetical protein F0562_027791 [Nyssa sinensis]|uniref:Uncharacterized protein n=1 Tax=Nyssa sinensis TaxID=561372 RepID=A0A5J5B4Q7_9ASTE|nr:hypothetical protein F0562_027791 [Nyssa sinensis]